MARIEWIHDRLLNWARWRLTQGSGPLGYAGMRWDDQPTGVRDPYSAEAPIPTNAIEASETDTAVGKLPSDLKATVTAYYTHQEGEARILAHLCCSKATMYARIDRAHRLLADHFNARRERAQAEQARVAGVVQAARP